MGMRDEVLEQPAVAARLLERARKPIGVDRRGGAAPGPDIRRDRRARHVQPRRHLRAVRAGRARGLARRPRRAVDRLALRRRAAIRGRAGHRRVAVGGVARRGVGRGAGTSRAPSRSRSRTTRRRRWRRPRSTSVDLSGWCGTGGRGDEDLHGRAGRPRDAGHGARRVRRGAGRDRGPRRDPRADRRRARGGAGGAPHRRGPGRGRSLHRARPWLPVRHRTRVGAQAQGARLRPRRPVLIGGLPARAAGTGQRVDPGPRRRAVGRHGGRHGHAPPAPPGPVRRTAPRPVRCGGDA